MNFIITINSKYKKISDLFFQLLNKNLDNANINVYLSMDKSFEVPVVSNFRYVNSLETLPSKIKSIVEQTNHQFYICLLGDAFICDKIDLYYLDSLLQEMSEKGIDYCNLIPKHSKKRSKKLYSYIKKRKRYGVSFIAFIASRNFILNNFDENLTDFDFENKYLINALFCEKKETYDNMIILNSNLFNIYHGISNGKWIRKSHRKVSKNGIYIDKTYKKQNFLDELKNLLSDFSSICMPRNVRLFFKKMLLKCGLKTKTKI